ncbi:MAG: hypothetical protein FD149_838 [Rhodospirillaceae bacterium]|nr:MAG: hypothetical protein FD149_838 [Rhodospirillaceae bacterium]
MLKIIAYVIVVAALVSVSVWMAERPGTVTVEWQGWRLDTTLPVLVLLLAVGVGGLALGVQGLARLRAVPRLLRRRRSDRRWHKGYAALNAGFAALAAGDAPRATRMASKAVRRLDDPEASLLLQAQAAELAGDEPLVRKYYGLLRANPATELVGIKGLIAEARRAERHEEVLALAKRAVAVRPVAWAVRLLFESLVRERRWAEAEASLVHGRPSGAFGPEVVERHRVVLQARQALEVEAAGDRRAALRLARRALNKEAGMIPAVLLAARLYAAKGRKRKAARVLEKAWRHAPHPALAEAYGTLWPEEDSLKRTQRAGRLAAGFPDHPESRLLVAGAALEAQLWGQARSQLALLLAPTPSRRVAAMMARLEQAEHNEGAATEWLQRIGTAPTDACWRCRMCGTEAPLWDATCTHCGGFDSLVWAAPSRALVVSVERTHEPNGAVGEA